MANDILLQPRGSTDWAGGAAPAGGTHTGVTTLTMNDGATFVVAHSKAEVLAKMDRHAVAQTTPRWVAFDQPGRGVSVVIDTNQIASPISRG